MSFLERTKRLIIAQKRIGARRSAPNKKIDADEKRSIKIETIAAAAANLTENIDDATRIEKNVETTLSAISSPETYALSKENRVAKNNRNQNTSLRFPGNPLPSCEKNMILAV